MVRFTKNVANTVTHNGGSAFTLSNKQELVKTCLTSFLKSDFYEKMDEKIERLKSYVSQVDVEFALKLSVFSREYGLRSVNHVIFVEAAKKLYGKAGVRKTLTNYLEKAVRRPDELMDIVGYYALSNGQNMNSVILPDALKFAIRNRLQKFNEYQLGKYKGTGDVNLFDLVNLTHAKSEAIDKLMKNTLETPETWETMLSSGADKKETFEKLMAGKNLGALATIRNLRNMLQAGVNTSQLVAHLDSMNWKDVFPFQAIQALDAVYSANLNGDAIYGTVMKNVKESFRFIAERYKGKIAIGVDVSGSMFCSYGENVKGLTSMDRAKMALTYALVLQELFETADVYLWSTSCYKLSTDNVAIAYDQAAKISSGTQVRCFTDEINNKGYDYAIILTDEQISDHLDNVAANKTVVWGLHDYENTISNGANLVYFTGYNDIMWKVASDLNRLGELEAEISKIEL